MALDIVNSCGRQLLPPPLIKETAYLKSFKRAPRDISAHVAISTPNNSPWNFKIRPYVTKVNATEFKLEPVGSHSLFPCFGTFAHAYTDLGRCADLSRLTSWVPWAC